MGREEVAADEWVVRHLERMPLGTAYTAVTARVVELAQHKALVGNCRLVVDATGVGMPVVDMLRAARPGCEIAAVLITGGPGRALRRESVACAEAGLIGADARAVGTEAAAHLAADAREWNAGAGVDGYAEYAASERTAASGRGRGGGA